MSYNAHFLKKIYTLVNDSLTYMHKFIVVMCVFWDICVQFDFRAFNKAFNAPHTAFRAFINNYHFLNVSMRIHNFLVIYYIQHTNNSINLYL